MVGIYNLPVFLALSIYLLFKLKSITVQKELFICVGGMVGIWVAMAIFARFFLYTVSYYGVFQMLFAFLSPIFNFGGLLTGVIAASLIFNKQVAG